MDYKAESLETNFGKGVKIEKGGRSYEQFSCRDGLFARVYQTPYEKDGQLVNTDYHGVIFRAPFQDTDSDYEQFKVLAERLQQASGEEVPNSKARFMDYISHSGLEQELSRIGANVRINLKDRERLPNDAESWLNLKSYLGGAITSLAGYAGGFAIIANAVPDAKLSEGLAMYWFFAPVIEGVSGLLTAIISDRFWCGPMHAPGFITSRILHSNRLRNPNYMLEKFMQNYQRLDAMGSSVGNQKQYAKQSKKADRHFGVLEDMFPFTRHQRGFSITYDSPNRDNIINFFDYVLEGGNAPQLPNPQARTQKPKTQEKTVEIKPVETNFINPWEVQIPELGGKKNE